RINLDPAAAVLPLLTDAKAGVPPRGSVTVNLPGEGVAYGFHIVVRSKAGRSLPPPKAGDLPQLRLEYDATPPRATIYPVEPDPVRRDAVLVRWEATDRNLSANPVSLEWAPTAAGPWAFIGPQEHPATGQYSWQVTPDVPPNVFLRIKAKDAAGNLAVGQSDKAVAVDLSVPDAHFIGVGGPR